MLQSICLNKRKAAYPVKEQWLDLLQEGGMVCVCVCVCVCACVCEGGREWGTTETVSNQ